MSPIERNPNGQVKQEPHELSPADGSGGFVGSNTGPALGMDVISGKKGYTKDMSVWSEETSFPTSAKDNSGSQDGKLSNGGSDSTDEYATYKKPQNDEGLIQTFRDSEGAGDAGPSSGPDGGGMSDSTQSVPGSDSGDHEMSDMPQTEFTHQEGSGAPLFKRG